MQHSGHNVHSNSNMGYQRIGVMNLVTKGHRTGAQPNGKLNSLTLRAFMFLSANSGVLMLDMKTQTFLQTNNLLTGCRSSTIARHMRELWKAEPRVQCLGF